MRGYEEAEETRVERGREQRNRKGDALNADSIARVEPLAVSELFAYTSQDSAATASVS